MPFIEAGITDRLADGADASRHARLARRNAAPTARTQRTDLRTAADRRDASQRVTALLWHGEHGDLASPLQRRLLRLGARLTGSAETGRDLLHDAWIYVSEHFADVSDAEGYLLKYVRSRALNVVRDRAYEQQADSIVDIAERLEENRTQAEWHPEHDAARQTLQWFMDHIAANGIERKILRLASAFGDDWEAGSGSLWLYPDMAAIAREVGLSEFALRQHCKAMGLRAGVWTSERKWAPPAIGPRRSNRWFQSPAVRSIWDMLWRSESINAWYDPLENRARRYADWFVTGLLIDAAVLERRLALPAPAAPLASPSVD